MTNPLISFFTGRGSRRIVETVTPERTLADVVLPPQTRHTLDQALAQVRNHTLIFNSWGLGQRHTKGRGLTFNFAGSPGTGKTICAEAIAHAVGLKLIVVDYAEAESMWVGETPKNIAAIFRAAAGRFAFRVSARRGSNFTTASGNFGSGCDARPAQQRRQAVIPLVAARLIINLVRRIALLLQLLLDGPWSRPRRRVVNGDHILDGVRVETRPPFHQMQIFVSSLKIEFRREIRDVDDERVAVPMAS